MGNDTVPPRRELLSVDEGPKKNYHLEDVERRQRNLAFLYTTQNEARFWRNIGNPT